MVITDNSHLSILLTRTLSRRGRSGFVKVVECEGGTILIDNGWRFMSFHLLIPIALAVSLISSWVVGYLEFEDVLAAGIPLAIIFAYAMLRVNLIKQYTVKQRGGESRYCLRMFKVKLHTKNLVCENKLYLCPAHYARPSLGEGFACVLPVKLGGVDKKILVACDLDLDKIIEQINSTSLSKFDLINSEIPQDIRLISFV